MLRSLQKENNSTRLIEMGILSMALFPIVPNNLKGVPVIILLILSLFFYKNEERPVFKKRLFFNNSIIYWLYAIGLFYSSNIPYALQKLETGLSLIVFPLIFALIWNIRKRIDKELLVKEFTIIFFSSVFIYTIIIFSFLFTKGIIANFEDPNFIRHFTQNIPIIGLHPIYASIFLSLGLLFSIFIVFKTRQNHIRIAVLFIDSLILLLLISLASKGVILAFLIASSVFLIKYIGNFKRSIYIIALISGVIALGIVFSPSLSSRMNRLISSLNLSTQVSKENSTDIRKAVYLCSINSIKGKWIFGHGIGDIEDELMKCYHNTSELLVEGQYNTHNQYLSILLSNGILGLFGTFFFLYWNFNISLKRKDHLFFSVLLFYSIVMFMENILARQSGVIMFAFLVNFFYFQADYDKTRIKK